MCHAVPGVGAAPSAKGRFSAVFGAPRQPGGGAHDALRGFVRSTRSAPNGLLTWLVATLACVAGAGCILGPKQDDPTPSAVADTSVTGGAFDSATGSDAAGPGGGCGDDKTGSVNDGARNDACPLTDAAGDVHDADGNADADADADADAGTDATDDAGETTAG